MAGDDLFWIADRGQVDAVIPSRKYIDVRQYTFQLSIGEGGRFLVWERRGQEGVQQLRDSNGVHAS